MEKTNLESYGMKGIDVSNRNGNINFTQIKAAK